MTETLLLFSLDVPLHLILLVKGSTDDLGRELEPRSHEKQLQELELFSLEKTEGSVFSVPLKGCCKTARADGWGGSQRARTHKWIETMEKHISAHTRTF